METFLRAFKGKLKLKTYKGIPRNYFLCVKAPHEKVIKIFNYGTLKCNTVIL